MNETTLMTANNFNSFKAFITRSRADLMHVLYPGFCLVCDMEIPHSSESICPICTSELHYTHFEDYTEPTPLDTLFWGRLRLNSTYTMLYFDQSTSTQRILHALKYKDRPDVARHYGSEMGQRMQRMEVFSDLDALIPVPLHPKKEFLRGYNQSALLAEGISEQLGAPIETGLLKRVAFTESQTKKNRLSRWENMQHRFRAVKVKQEYKHVAIVDDVVTTGSTIETCVNELKALLPECKISVVSLAMAK